MACPPARGGGVEDEAVACTRFEIVRLKREVAKLKAERDILKKAAAYFAKEST
jgi:transposase